MPTAVASAIAPQISQSHVQQDLSPKPSYPALAPSKNTSSSPHAERKSPASNASNPPAAASSEVPVQQSTPEGKRSSPNSHRSGRPPKIVVKKEPSSPENHTTSRHRPPGLDLTSTAAKSTPSGMASKPSGPLTAREAAMGMHDVGLACLSPGFQTQDPTMQQQLQRSYSVRDQQRHIIESRLQKSAKPTDGDSGRADSHQISGGLKTSIPSSSKKRPNPGLSIVPPSHEQFANERVVQSAPLHQTFTGRHQPHPLTRHVVPAGPDSSHVHSVPAPQTANRLPPITDVFANEHIGMSRDGQPRSGPFPQQSGTAGAHRPSFPSPSLQGPTSAAQHQQQQRPREYRSAEEAVAELTSGREDLLPKLVHYGGHQPGTPPSPSGQHGQGSKHPHIAQLSEGPRSGSGARRRMRTEYERDNGSPPLGSGPSPHRPFGEGRDSPETTRRKKDEFLGLCARAWDLFHS